MPFPRPPPKTKRSFLDHPRKRNVLSLPRHCSKDSSGALPRISEANRVASICSIYSVNRMPGPITWSRTQVRGSWHKFLDPAVRPGHFSDDLLQWASCTAWALLLSEGCIAGSVAPPDLRCAACDVRGGSFPSTPAGRAPPCAGRVLGDPSPPPCMRNSIVQL